MALRSFSHIGICVSDLDRSTRFYRDVLGFAELFTVDFDDGLPPTMERPNAFTSRMLARDDLRIELLRWHDDDTEGDGERRPMNRLGMTHLCFRVDDAAELFDIAERCHGAAWRDTMMTLPVAEVFAEPMVAAYITDPDGTRIECISNSPDLSVALQTAIADYFDAPGDSPT